MNQAVTVRIWRMGHLQWQWGRWRMEHLQWQGEMENESSSGNEEMEDGAFTVAGGR